MQEAKRLREAANGAGLLASIWGYFTGSNAEAGKPSETIKSIKANIDTNANISANNANSSANNANISANNSANSSANNDAIIDGNANNNAANRSAI